MRIQFERSGGFAGMRMGTTVDTHSLSAEKAQNLQDLVEAANFFGLPATIQSSGEGADRFQYNITVESEGKSHTVEVGESAVPESLRPLLNQLTTLARSGPGV
jgi:hypothetical protein